MSDDNFDDEDVSDVDLNYKPKSLVELKDKLPSFSLEKLCEIVVLDRCFGGKKDLAIMCMEELANRRIAGETFDFESYIDKSYSEMPKLEINMPDISSVLRQFVAGKARR